MCNCADDEVDPEKLLAPRPCPEVSPQDQTPQRRHGQQGCCGSKRRLTYEDETLPKVSCCGGEQQKPSSPPPLPTTPVQPCRPTIRRCELVGTAIVRRRIDCGTSPERRDASSREVTATDQSKDKSTTETEKDADKSKDESVKADKSKDESVKADESIAAEEPEISGTAATPEKSTGEEKKPEGESATSTPCPGKTDPQKDCNCSIIPKT